MKNFVHLHVHSQYSILDGACKVPELVAKAREYGMPAVALTDHGNLYGAKHFFNEAKKVGIKPIIGVEAYLAEKSRTEKDSPQNRGGYHLIILAKNLTGYYNLLQLISAAHLEGLYYKPRVDKDLLQKYHEGLIVSSACLGGEVPQLILKGKIDQAREAALWYKQVFGDDFYLELMRHKTGDPKKDEKTFAQQQIVNKHLIEFSKELGIKLIATNDVHFLNKEDREAHEILICLNTNKKCDDPNRKLIYTGEEYFKSPDEMWELFADVPEALENTLEIAEKVEAYDIDRDPIMPVFEIPPEFDDDYQYLRHLTYQGAKERWGDPLPEEVVERLEFELQTIKKMGYPSYFLIVWDFIRAAREELGVWVGPGRGSAAGSAVAYALKITNLDPIKYNLLFERFLNPDRISMPDIDVDFDEDGRDIVLKWVAKKYGEKRVANIITFTSMAPKMAIRDITRVLGYPIALGDKLAKLVPDKAKNFAKAYEMSNELREVRENGSPEERRVLELSEKLEGSIRQTGIHACGVIIGRDDLVKFIPLTQTKDSVLFAATQYDGAFVEEIGLLKMDFLALRMLSIMKDAVENIKHSKGVEIDLDKIPLDDKKTFELYSKGETTAIFQFESDGMKKYLRQLKPNRFEDLIAMNALYRPGPMDYIPKFIARKHGKEKIEYDWPLMEDILKETYGVTVYQEQVMLLSQKLAGFTRGEADRLRKAMGKKKRKIIEELKPKFIEGCKKNNIPEDVALKIWHDWESFASYAFNKSHSTCYAYLSYQTAYLKAHYPAEYMAASLSRNVKDIKKVSLFMDECKRIGIPVLGPDVNESRDRFIVNKKGAIRYGLAAIKGVGKAAAEEIVRERDENGPYKDIYDFIERVNLQAVNKKVLESLVMSGALDNISPYPRAQYFAPIARDGGPTFLEELLKYGTRIQQRQKDAAKSLFGDEKISTKKPQPVKTVPEWSDIEKLSKEKELIGIYMSAHPLDDDKAVIKAHTNATIHDIVHNLQKFKGKEVRIAGIVIESKKLTSKNGNPYGKFTLEDFTESHSFALFGETYARLAHLVIDGAKLLLIGKVEPRYNNPDELEFKIYDIKPLNQLKVSKIAIKLSLDDLDTSVVDKIKQYSAENNGGARLQFLIYDPETKVWSMLKSRSNTVKLTKDFLDLLEVNNITYKLYV